MIDVPVLDFPEVLVADPDVQDSAQYAHTLGLLEDDVVRVADGRDALVKALREPYALIIADTHLPLIDGYVLCGILRSEPATRTTPIVMVTSDSGSSVRDRALGAGADALLVKPIEGSALLANAQQLIQRSHELRDRSNRTLFKMANQLCKARSLLETRLSQSHQRFQTTEPPVAPPPLQCSTCDRALTYQWSHVAAVSVRHPEQWDYYTCPSGCGRFQFLARTRSVRRV